MYRRGARPCWPRQRPSSAPALQPSPSTWLLSRLYAEGALHAENRSEGGARFVMGLPAAGEPVSASASAAA
ncbi:hypothetical protein D187_008497 [Cystobacter fuscus DSM 2262]|uniref:Uncharacterized protein n=1 Tax=Cystobacter fuscus (strain ATCC 25194 / DSM 2262 / NBRC 100088 / M29) TaxID=1242864 RepID=S9PD46_CYSF2|nr:hypothetical protein D187_008497 [Cystobacter fuscus DSM 2262]